MGARSPSDNYTLLCKEINYWRGAISKKKKKWGGRYLQDV